MGEVLYHNAFKSKTGVIYSCDMIRLNITIIEKEIDRFIRFLNHVNMDIDYYDMTYFECHKPYNYRHLWNIKILLPYEVSFAIGLDLGRNRDDRFKGYIEFNPNKCCNNTTFLEFYDEFKYYAYCRELVRYDMAIDIPNSRSECHLMRNQRSTYHTIIDRLCGITQYQGKRSNNGFVKLYDKTIESKLSYPLTRFEITLSAKFIAWDYLPKVFITDEQFSLLEISDLSPNDRVLIQLIRISDDWSYYMSQLTYRKRKKIEPYLANKTLDLDMQGLNAIRSVALSYSTL